MTFTLKTLELHAKVVTTLLDKTDCDYSSTGSLTESCGAETHSWFISRPVNDDQIGVEQSLESLSIPYDRSHRGPQFRLYSTRMLRIDEDQQQYVADLKNGDSTIRLMEELEDAIAGSDYTLVRNFIARKRKLYLMNLNWASQVQYVQSYEVA